MELPEGFMSKFEVVCKGCGSVDVVLLPREYADGKIHIWAECRDCKVKEAISQNQGPESFIMPFGKHRGQPISWIVENDRQYAEWVLRSDLKENIKLQFAHALE